MHYVEKESPADEIYSLLSVAGLGDIARVGFGRVKFGKRELNIQEAILMAERLEEAVIDIISAVRKDIYEQARH